MITISLDALVTSEHLDTTRHAIASWKVQTIVVDGDMDVTALPCECGRWVEIRDYDY